MRDGRLRVRYTSDFRTPKIDSASVLGDIEWEGNKIRSVTALEVTPIAIRRAEAAMTVMMLNCWLSALPKIRPVTAPTLDVPIRYLIRWPAPVMRIASSMVKLMT